MVRDDVRFWGGPVLFLMIVVLGTFSRAAEEESGVSLYPETHRGWASRLAGGGIKGEIWISERGLLDARELQRQVEILGEIRVIQASGGAGAERQKRLAKLEVLICSDAAWGRLSADERMLIEERVRKGMGLVLVGLEAQAVFDDATDRWEATERPRELEAEYSMPLREGARNEVGEWATHRLEGGRIAVFRGAFGSMTQELVPYDFAEGIEPSLLYEYHLAPLARAVLWVGQREAQVRIAGIRRAHLNEPDALEIPPQLTPEFTQYMLDARMKTLTQKVAVQFDRPAPRNYDIFVRVRQPKRSMVWSYEAGTLRKGQSGMTLHILAGKGESWIDLWIMRGTDVVDWISYRSALEEWPTLSDVQFSKWIVQRSDSVEVTFKVEKNSRRPAPTYAFFLVSDSLGRVLTERRVVVGEEGGDIRTNISWTDALTRSMKLEVYLSENRMDRLTSASRKYSSYASTALIVEQPRTAGLQWIASGASRNDAWTRIVNGRLAELGVDTIDVADQLWEGQGGASANLSAVSHVEVFSRRFEKSDAIRDPCLTSPEFRQELYETFANWTGWARSRGTHYVFLDGISRVLSEGGAYCGSVTCRRHLQTRLQSYYPNIERLNANWKTEFSSWKEVTVPPDGIGSVSAGVDVARIREEIRLEAFKEARDRLSGHWSALKSGIFYTEGGVLLNSSEWIPELTLFSIPPDHLLMEKVRSYRRSDAIAGVRLNEKDAAASKRMLWSALFHGMTAVWSGGAGEDGQVSDDVVLFAEEIDAVRGGIDVLLQSSDRVSASVGIYENAASIYAATQEEREAITETQGVVVQDLEGLGLGYEFVSYADLMETGLSEYKLVILPRVRAMSSEEEAFLERFAAKGGVLIVDGTAGEVDEHGAARSGNIAVFEAAEQISFGDEGAGREPLEAAAEEASVPRLYPEMIGAGKSGASFEWFHYRYGKAELIGILADEGEKGDVPTMRFPEGRAVYDALSGEMLKTAKARVSLNDAGAGLICVLPYRVSRIVVDMPEMVLGGRRLHFSMQIKTFDALPGDHLLHVKLIDEAGDSVRYYETTVECVNGSGEGYIPLAMNETPGRYTLVIRDVMTGVTTSKRIRIV